VEQKILEERIFNVDETGISKFETTKKVLAKLGMKEVGRMTCAETG
jgi:hypothetical protein